jgi:hypothetical protein
MPNPLTSAIVLILCKGLIHAIPTRYAPLSKDSNDLTAMVAMEFLTKFVSVAVSVSTSISISSEKDVV